MRSRQTVYRGERLTGDRGEVLGVLVTVDGRPLPPVTDQRAPVGPPRFEWGYGGAGPRALAVAIVADATGDREVARVVAPWFMWATAYEWGATWSITAGQVLDLVAEVTRVKERQGRAAATRARTAEGGAR